MELEVYSNKLSGLIPVDGSLICSAKGGEHYCDCGSDCLSNSISCGCKEAQSCCAPILEEYGCIICESTGFAIPDFLIESMEKTCSSAGISVKENVEDYGNYEACKEIKSSMVDICCLCLNKGPSPIV